MLQYSSYWINRTLLRVTPALVLGFLLSAYADPSTVEVCFPSDISSKTAQEGQLLTLKTCTGLLDVTAIVSEIKRGERMMKPGRIRVEAISTTDPAGNKISLRGFIGREATQKADNLLCPSITCAMINGKDAVIKKDEKFSALILDNTSK